MADSQPVAVVGRLQLGQIDSVVIDAVITETHSYSSEITEHEVEAGAKISDHARPLADKLQLECLISNTPLSREQQSREVEQGQFVFNTTAADDSPRNSPGRAGDAHDKLKQMQEDGKLVSVTTSLRTYTSMEIEGLTITRDAATGEALKFSCALKQVRIIETKRAKNVVSQDERVGEKKKKGHQVAKDPGVEKSALVKTAEAGKDSQFSSISGASNFMLSGGQ